ncbi:MAG: LysR family transcriptional regulator [Sphingobacteriales bacterium]|jgi:DNA-binding transcriptional LysR family regulator|nr:LysR family transcriptional regulator [Sphingobacteriales bacterium]
MNYTLNQLQIFLKVVQLKSVTKASEAMNLTQPAVSIQLKNFQDQFDIPLTEIIGRKIYITEFGKEIALAAENILNQVSAINYKTQAFKGKLTGRLKISVVSTGKYVLPYFLSKFIAENDGIELNVEVTNKQMVAESLENNEIDFALVSILPANMQIEKLNLLYNKLYLVGSKIPEEKIGGSPKDVFKDLPLIFREKGSGTRQIMERYFQQKQISVLKKLELSSNEAVKQALMAGLGYSIMPLIGIKNELHNKELHIIPTPGLPIKSNWSMIWLKNKKLSPVASAFLAHLKKEKTSIVEEKFSWYEEY